MCLIAALLGSTTAFAEDSAQSATTANSDVALFKPYTAEYKTSARGLSLTLKRKLRLNDQGVYILTNGGSALVVGFEEEAQFQIEGNRIIPSSYVYQGTGLMSRRREVHFTEGADTLRSLYKDKWYDLPYTANTLDRMSQQEQVRLLLLNDPTPGEDIVITVADKKRVKVYTLSYVGEETIKTPLGTVDTLHFRRVHDDPDRKSDTWVAPSWDFAMVKTVHIEDGKPIEGMITSLSIDGKRIGSK
ncbi:MAG: DUF3108 domain-containing protein [Gammaproteobacteria bacterium]|nr:MAG: DUF3108 domain-containing protein [Gammaproteobacteria bacterium]